MRFTILLEVWLTARHSVEYEVTLQADGVGEAMLQATNQAWEEFGEDMPITIKRWSVAARESGVA